MKPFILLALWAVAGWDVGAWAEVYAGVPAHTGLVAGIALGAAMAVELRRRADAGAQRTPQAPDLATTESASALDRTA